MTDMPYEQAVDPRATAMTTRRLKAFGTSLPMMADGLNAQYSIKAAALHRTNPPWKRWLEKEMCCSGQIRWERARLEDKS